MKINNITIKLQNFVFNSQEAEISCDIFFENDKLSYSDIDISNLDSFDLMKLRVTLKQIIKQLEDKDPEYQDALNYYKNEAKNSL